MSNLILIIGESGTGKSTSLENLDHKETFLINVLNKPLPFRGWRKKYVETTKENPKGNLLTTDSSSKIENIIKRISIKRPDIKTIIIDDFQYTMANDFMRKAMEKGFDKFTQIGQNVWKIITESQKCRPDLNIYFLMHLELDANNGKKKAKTIGKMLDEKITLEGLFTIVLFTSLENKEYTFITQNDGNNTGKSPKGMFESFKIPNDLALVNQKINEYYQ